MKFLKTDFIAELKASRGDLILGHRGCRKSDVIENTLPAFKRAFEIGADGIDNDVETASDGRLVVVNRWFAKKELGFFPWGWDSNTIRELARENGWRFRPLPKCASLSEVIQMLYSMRRLNHVTD